MGPPNVSFACGLRFEIFFSLQLLCDTSAQIHSTWSDRILTQCPADLLGRMEELRLSPLLWTALADVPGTLAVEAPYEELVQVLEACPLERFRQRMLYHFFHDPSSVQALCDHEITLAEAIHLGVERNEGDWLSFAGLYPYREAMGLAQALETIIRDPAAVLVPSLRILREYWDLGFRQTWAALSQQLWAKKEEKHRLYVTSDFETFARAALIPVEWDDRRQLLRAVRSGHEHHCAAIDSLVFCPSVFNYRRLRAVIETQAGGLAFYFPFFLPELGLTEASGATTPAPDPSYHLDAALIFRALGDTTRYAIASTIAREPTSSAQLARKLSLTRPTVSHHVRILREAGLLVETHSAGSVLLALRRPAIEQISRLAQQQLFG
jgi:ArsR family transcriptional regulator